MTKKRKAHCFSVLLIEDDPTDVLLIKRSLSMSKVTKFDIDQVGTLAEGRAKAQASSPDIILLDLSLPDAQGWKTIESALSFSHEQAVIVLTGLDDEGIAVDAVKAGAQEYLLKSEIGPEMLPRIMRYAMERKRYELSLQQLTHELELRVQQRTDELLAAHRRALQNERLATLGAMVTGLAHESRNALQRIVSSINRLNRQLDTASVMQKNISEIQNAVEDLTTLFESVKKVATPISIKQTQSYLPDLWTAALYELMYTRGNLNYSVEENYPRPFGLINIDPFKFKQVFRNIFENSLNLIPDNIQFYIGCTESISASHYKIQIDIIDNGPGVEDKFKETIFDPFFSSRQGGTGLGMSISRRIIEGHDGSLTVHDSPIPELNGACFRICLSFELSSFSNVPIE